MQQDAAALTLKDSGQSAAEDFEIECFYQCLGLCPAPGCKHFASVKTKNLPREHAGTIVPDRTEMLELKNIRFNAALGEMTAVEFADHLRIAFGAIAH